MNVYIVTMYRYGNRESHSYVLGAFTDPETAFDAGDVENAFRGEKYDPEVIKVILDADVSNNLDVENETVYNLEKYKNYRDTKFQEKYDKLSNVVASSL